MKIKKFEAPNLKDALEKIKIEMGPDAFILGTKSIKKKGPLGFGERTFLQITAAVEDPEPGVPVPTPSAARPAVPNIDVRQDEESSWRPLEKKAEQVKKAEPTPTYNARGKSSFTEGFEAVFAEGNIRLSEPDSSRSEGSNAKKLRKEISELRGMVEELKNKPADLQPLQKEIQELKSLLYNVVRNQGPLTGNTQSPLLLSFYSKFVEGGVIEALAAKLVQIADKKLTPEAKNDPRAVWRYLRKLIRQTIDIAGPMDLTQGETKVIVLVGPTGVGKTTTLAKLSAYAALQKQAGVALITLDTYRISAVDQLKNYAKIMEIPIQVALNMTDLRQALQFHQDKSLILVDTAGHSQNDVERMNGLRQLLQGEEDLEIHLCLSATTKAHDLNDIVKKFSVLNPKFLIFTKLDETHSYGALFNQIVKTKIPVSYVTTGQAVPEDLEFATKDFLADLIMGKGLKKGQE